MFPYFRSASQLIHSWFASPRHRPIRRQASHARLRIEQLEVRIVPALNIVPNFVTTDLSVGVSNPQTISSDPNAATIEATINTAISNLEAAVANDVTVYITFQEMASGLGESSKGVETIPYIDYANALVNINGPSAAQVSAIAASVPVQTDNPVNGNPNIAITVANALALGTDETGATSVSATISLNTSVCNLSRASNNPADYDLGIRGRAY